MRSRLSEFSATITEATDVEKAKKTKTKKEKEKNRGGRPEGAAAPMEKRPLPKKRNSCERGRAGCGE